MKWNFGTAIFLAYSVFAAALIFMVIRSTQVDHSLVVDDYYAKDLAYQEILDRKQNSLQRSGAAIVQQSEVKRGHLLELQFPHQRGRVSGQVQLYRPDNQRLDQFFPIEAQADGRMTIQTASVLSGYWRVRIEWEQAGMEYLDEYDLQVLPVRAALSLNK